MTWSQPWRCIPRSLKQWKLQVTQSTRAVRYLANSRNSSSCNPHSTTVVSFVQTVTQTQRRDLASVKILCTCCKTQRISNRRMPVLSNIFKRYFEDSNKISETLFDKLREHFTESEIVELTFLIGYINMLNWFNNALQVEYRGELASN